MASKPRQRAVVAARKKRNGDVGWVSGPWHGSTLHCVSEPGLLRSSLSTRIPYLLLCFLAFSD